MSNRLRQTDVSEVYKKEGYILLDKYKNASTKLLLRDAYGYYYLSKISEFKKNKKPRKFSKYNPYTIQNIKLWIKTNAIGYELLSEEYIDAKEKLTFMCNNNHKFDMTWSNFQQGDRCPYCCNKKVLKGYNDIATTDPWMIDLGMSIEDAETHTHSSGKRIVVKCPNCKKEKEIIIYSVFIGKSIRCSCSDGTPYAEKFIISLLDQLDIKYKHDSYWIENKRYDFYLPDYNIILECHGMQHYDYGFDGCGGDTLQEVQENDKYKRELALNNGINHYIELDCRKSEFEFIKTSILNSELNNIFDLNKIDWCECEKYSLSNRVKEICEYWRLHNEINNDEFTIEYVSKIFNLDRHTISIFLKQGSKIGWCNYNYKEEMKKRMIKRWKTNTKMVEVFKDNSSLGIFSSCMEIERKSIELFGIKLFNSGINQVCNGKLKQYKGFTFRYVINKEEI